MFITFEGIDGCGKTTQIKLLADYFISRGKDVLSLREPGGTAFAEKIRDILLSRSNQISPMTELFLFEAARSDLVNNVINPALAQGKFVLCDRFFDSTTAYQGYGRRLGIDDINRLNLIATHNLKPDITFFMDIPIEISHLRSRKKDFDRIELAGDGFFQRVIDGFAELSEQEPLRIFRIDASGSIEETRLKILDIIEKFEKTINVKF